MPSELPAAWLPCQVDPAQRDASWHSGVGHTGAIAPAPVKVDVTLAFRSGSSSLDVSHVGPRALWWALISVAILLGCWPTDLAFAADHYVDAFRGDDLAGTGAADQPWRTIGHALSQMMGSDGVIHVGPGVYSPGTLPGEGEVFPLRISRGISLLGAGAGVTILDAQRTANVLTLYDADSGTHIDGFTIRNGVRTSDQSATDDAGGCVSLSDASPVITNNTITNCTASIGGSAISIGGESSPVITGNRFFDNTSYVRGGVIYVRSSGSVLIEDNQFKRNNLEALDGMGSAILIESIGPVQVVVRGNVIAPFGSGISAFYDWTDLTVSNNTIIGAGRSAIVLADGCGGSISKNLIAGSSRYGVEESNPKGIVGSAPITLHHNKFRNNLLGDYLASTSEGAVGAKGAAALASEYDLDWGTDQQPLPEVLPEPASPPIAQSNPTPTLEDGVVAEELNTDVSVEGASTDASIEGMDAEISVEGVDGEVSVDGLGWESMERVAICQPLSELLEPIVRSELAASLLPPLSDILFPLSSLAGAPDGDDAMVATWSEEKTGSTEAAGLANVARVEAAAGTVELKGEADVTAIKTTVGIQDAIGEVEASVAKVAIEAGAAETEASVAEVATETGAADARIAEVEADVGAAEASIAKAEADVGAAEASIAKAEADVGAADAGAAEASIAKAEAAVGAAEASIATVEADVGAAEASIAEASVVAAEADVGAAEASVAEASVAAVEADVGAAEASVVEAEADVGAVEASVAEVSVVAAEADVGAVEASVAEVSVVEAEADVGAAEASVVEAEADVGAVEASAAEVEVEEGAAEAEVVAEAAHQDTDTEESPKLIKAPIYMTLPKEEIYAGETVVATAKRVDGEKVNYDWSVEDDLIVTLDNNSGPTATIRGKRPGSTVITAADLDSGRAFAFALRVVLPKVAIIIESDELSIGDVITVDAATTKQLDDRFVWSSSDPEVALVVSKEGPSAEVEGLSGGSVTISAVGVRTLARASVSITVMGGEQDIVLISPEDLEPISSSSAPTFTWLMPDGAEVQLELSASSGFSDPESQFAYNTTDDTFVPPGSDWKTLVSKAGEEPRVWWRVVDSSDAQVVSDTRQFRLVPFAPPGSLAAVALSATEIEVTWELAETYERLMVFWNDHEKLTFRTEIMNEDQNKFVNGDLRPDLEYTFQLLAYREGQWVGSSLVSARTLPFGYSAPLLMSPSRDQDVLDPDDITFSWEGDDSDTVRYWLAIHEATQNLLVWRSTTETSYAMEAGKLAPDKEYYWCVWANDPSHPQWLASETWRFLTAPSLIEETEDGDGPEETGEGEGTEEMEGTEGTEGTEGMEGMNE